MIELRATYRLQLTPSFGFAAARGLVPYLRDLGISHLYLSPSFQARPGSPHGYDVIDPGRLSDALGGEAEFRALADSALGAGMGIILDVVPNHMAADDANAYWADPVLRERFFDVDPVSHRWRRFFDIDGLAGVRIECPEVFEVMSALPLRLLREGLVDGLRVDHPDGLADPGEYLHRLRAGGASRVWVEKILAVDEDVPREWPVSGTVGYEFCSDVCALFVDPAAEPAFTELWERVSGDARPFGEWAAEAKLEQARTTFAPEVERLARASDGLEAEEIAAAVSALPVYRTYETGAGEYVTRFQQTTPAIMAKGVEDTAFYRYARLLALCEVGGSPERFSLPVIDFHNAGLRRAERFPEGLLTTMTHDAKRSGDVRARIAALTWVPDEWSALAQRWIAGDGPPDAIERHLLLQTVLGALPIEPERLDGYVVKALREGKRNSSWIAPDERWEAACVAFARELAEHPDVRAFADRLAPLGRQIALGALVLKLTAPGVPDIYQGDELEFRALVDPDNRRPVDWQLREALLARLLGGGHVPDEPKLWVTAKLLALRARRPEVFARGSYTPLNAGPETCAFRRGDAVMVTVRLRPTAPPAQVPVEPPDGDWRELLGDLDGVAVYERI